MSFVLTKQVVQNIFESTENALRYVEKSKDMSPELVLSDPRKSIAFKYGYLVVLQSILTLSNYVVVKKKLGIPKDYLESLQFLVTAKILPKNLTGKLKLLVEMRDTILHRSASITLTDIKNMIENIETVKEIYQTIKTEVQKLLGA